MENNQRGFTSNIGAIAAAAGSAIGLGNIWRFPYTLGQNGGGAFLLIYIIFVIFLGVPLMMTEFAIGRRSQSNVVGAYRVLSPKHKGWMGIGILGLICGFMIYSFYSVVAGWTLNYIALSATGGFAGKDAAAVGEIFTQFTQSSYLPLITQAAFLILTGIIVVMGVQKGIEKFTKILMPILFLLMILLCVRSVTLDGASEGLKFLFKPDFNNFTATGVLSALGQAMFSLSIGMGLLVTYGSYIRKNDDLLKTSVCIAGTDTLIALLAGIAIFPAVFAFGLSPESGPSLVFITLPNVFNNMPLGMVFALLFFVLLAIAALTSTISLLEILVLWAVEELKMKRITATILISFVIFAIGAVCSLSLGSWSDFTIGGLCVFDLFDELTATYFMPIGALAFTIFFGWFYRKEEVWNELSNGGTLKAKYFKIYYFIIRYIAPLALIIVLITGALGIGN